MCFKWIKIILHSLLEEMLRMYCKNSSGKGGCFLARRKGSKPKKRRERDKRHRALSFLKATWLFLQITAGIQSYSGLVSAIFLSFEGCQLSRLEREAKEVNCKNQYQHKHSFLSIPSSLEIDVELIFRWQTLLIDNCVSLFACFLTPGKEDDGICLIEQWSGLKHFVGFLALASLARIVTFSGFFSQRNLPAPCYTGWCVFRILPKCA